MANHLGSQVLDFWSHHIDSHRLDICQTDGRAIVLGMDDHLIRRVADMGKSGVPKEFHLRLHTKGRLGIKHRRTDRHLERRTRSGQRNVVAVGVGSGNDEIKLFACHEAILLVALDLRQVVVAV